MFLIVPEDFLTLANSAAPDEMQHYASLFANSPVSVFPVYQGFRSE